MTTTAENQAPAPLDVPGTLAKMERSAARLENLRAFYAWADSCERLAALVEGIPDDDDGAAEDAALVTAQRARVTRLLARFPAIAAALSPLPLPVAVCDEARADDCVAGGEESPDPVWDRAVWTDDTAPAPAPVAG